MARDLLTSAVRCFASNGFHATTTRDISGAIGLSPAALYVYFPSKELVLFEIIRAAHERRAGPHPGAGCPGPTETPPSASGTHLPLHRLARPPPRGRPGLPVRAGRRSPPSTTRRSSRSGTRPTTCSATPSRPGSTTGRSATVDVKRVARAMLSLSIDLVRWYRRDGSDSPEQLGEFNADLALRIVDRHRPA